MGASAVRGLGLIAKLQPARRRECIARRDRHELAIERQRPAQCRGIAANRQREQQRIADDLVDQLHARACGSVRNIVVGLGRIEQIARGRGVTAMSAGDWPRGQEFFLGNAPKAVTQKLTAVS